MNNLEQFNINNFLDIIQNIQSYDRFMHLKLYVVNDDQLKEKYIEHINNHLLKLFKKINFKSHWQGTSEVGRLLVLKAVPVLG